MIIAGALALSCSLASATAFAAISESEPNDSFDKANRISMGSTVYGQYDEDAVDDYYVVDLPKSGTVKVTFANDKYFSATFGCDFYLRIYNEYHEQVDYTWVSAKTTRPKTVTMKLSKGTNYVKFTHDNWTNSPDDGHPYHFKLAYKVAGTSVTKLAAGKKRFTAKWVKKDGAKQYQLRYASSKSMSGAKKVSCEKSTSKTVKNLKSGKCYYVQVRVAKVIGGKTYWSSWSAKKNVKIV